MTDLRCYLAGPVMHPSDGGHGWRDHVTTRYDDHGIEWANPLDKYDGQEVTVVESLSEARVPATHTEHKPGYATTPDGEEFVTAAAIVRDDKLMLESSDAVLVGWSRVPSVGTPMEVITAADQHEIPISIWFEPELQDADPVVGETLSPWLAHHADHVSGAAAECVEWLQTAAGGTQEVTAES